MDIVSVFLLILLILLLFIFTKKSRELSEEKQKSAKLKTELERATSTADNEIAVLTASNNELRTENERLSPYKVVLNADQKAAEIVNSANAVLEASKQDVKIIKEQATSALNSATLEARKIIDAARERAEKIAGDAYTSMQNAELYERTVTAMKNIIKGYGDQYIIPAHSLLDELASEFGYTEAGQELKKARDRARLMIRNGTAATCEYVEINRKETAINFVIDAFNGKADSTLSRVKSDNFGKLKKEIEDAFTIVNHNGQAFRNARITQEYLNTRLEELRWASVAQQLKIEAKEEQRRIREQIREEEKARREYEKALKEAAKEEEIIRRAMEKAKAQIEKATAEQKEKYMKQLEELQEKLKSAEEKNQRALSMAQQTKRGHVYIISNIGSFGENIYKIGLTRRLEPLDRIRELGDSSVPFEFDVHAMIFSDDSPGLENQLHKHFVMMQMNKVNHRKEFFKVDLSHIREEVEKLGLKTTWTMQAQAQEYRESLAIEQAINGDDAKKDAWLKRQLMLNPVVDFGDDETEIQRQLNDS